MYKLYGFFLIKSNYLLLLLFKTLFFWLQVIFGGHRPPLQVAICKTTLKLQIHAVATGVCLQAG